MAVTCMCRRSQLCSPPSTQTPESFKRRSACAARSNVLVSAAAQHGEGEALRHRRRACAALRGSAAGVPARDERRGHSQRRTPTPVFTLPLNLPGRQEDAAGGSQFYQAAQPLTLNMDWVHSLMFALTAVELLCFFGAYRAKKAGWESLVRHDRST